MILPKVRDPRFVTIRGRSSAHVAAHELGAAAYAIKAARAAGPDRETEAAGQSRSSQWWSGTRETSAWRIHAR